MLDAQELEAYYGRFTKTQSARDISQHVADIEVEVKRTSSLHSRVELLPLLQTIAYCPDVKIQVIKPATKNLREDSLYESLLVVIGSSINLRDNLMERSQAYWRLFEKVTSVRLLLPLTDSDMFNNIEAVIDHHDIP